MSNLTVVPETEAEAPTTTAEETTALVKVKAFVTRYEKVRRPGITLQALKGALQSFGAEKIEQDAKSSFGDLSVLEISRMLWAVDQEMEALAKKMQEARDAEEAAIVAEQQRLADERAAAAAAAKAEKEQAAEAVKAAKAAAKAAKRAPKK